MSAALTRSNAEPYEPDARQRSDLLKEHGPALYARLFVFGLSEKEPEDRVHEAAQRVIVDFLDGKRHPRIDPADEWKCLAAHLVGAMRSALDKRRREFRGRVKTTTTGGEAVVERDGDGPVSDPGIVLSGPESENPDRLSEQRDAVQTIIRELHEELARGDALGHRMLDIFHLDLDAREQAEMLGVPVLAVYEANRRISEAKARLATKKQKEKS
jgi:hypothetical protein